MYKLLAVDDSPEVQELIKIIFSPLRFSVYTATTFMEASKKIKEETFDLFILDLHLLDGDGLDLLSLIRQIPSYRNTPVLILSSREDIAYKLSAFSLGADDYVTKPFNTLEFKARIEMALRRFATSKSSEEVLDIGPFLLEVNKQRLQTKDKSQEIYLTPTEFRIFAMLAKKPEVIFSRNQIIDQIWGVGVAITDRTIDSHVYTLRKKLGPLSKHLRAVQGEGYRFSEMMHS